jgi:hypothetical protein
MPEVPEWTVVMICKVKAVDEEGAFGEAYLQVADDSPDETFISTEPYQVIFGDDISKLQLLKDQEGDRDG